MYRKVKNSGRDGVSDGVFILNQNFDTTKDNDTSDPSLESPSSGTTHHIDFRTLDERTLKVLECVRR